MPEQPTPPPNENGEQGASPASTTDPSDSGAESAEASNIDFMALVHSLSLNAMMMLGEAETPEHRFEVNLDQARHNIDMLAAIRDKTRGNLSEEENALLLDVVPRLQLLYTEKTEGK